MSWLLLAPAAVVMLALAGCRSVLGEVVAEEVRTRLDRMPRALIRLACLQLPGELRADLGGEWRAELQFVLAGTDGLPVSRFLRGIRFAAGLALRARRISRELAGAGVSGLKRLRVAYGSGLVTLSVAEFIWGVSAFAYGQMNAAAFAANIVTLATLAWLGIVTAAGRFLSPWIFVPGTVGAAVLWVQQPGLANALAVAADAASFCMTGLASHIRLKYRTER
jgi:hypothetical protein